MRWLRFEDDNGPCYGILEKETITAIEGSPFAEYQRTCRQFQLGKVKLLSPIIPTTFYCAGQNYVNHVKDPSRIPKKPDIGYRSNTALIGHDENVVMPPDATQVHYEGELAVVIGRKARRVSEEQAMDCVFGYTIGNDVSERVWQKQDRTLWRAKSTDTFKPMGPWIETDVDLKTMETTVTLNGEVRTQFATNDMVFGVAQFISAMSQYVTLYPGDVIWMGTDGVSPDLKAGDVVEIEISGIGKLRNRFTYESVE